MNAIPRRTNPRRRTILRLEEPGAREHRVLNLSVNGLFLEGDVLPTSGVGSLWLPGSERPLEVRFRNVFPRSGGHGVQFDPADRRGRQLLHDYVTHHHEEARLRQLEARLGGPSNLKPLGEEVSTRAVFQPLVDSQAIIDVYPSGDAAPVRARLVALHPLVSRLELEVDRHATMPRPYEPLFLALLRGHATYLADTVVESTAGGRVTVMLPERVFLPERRSLDREPTHGRQVLRLDVDGARLGEVVDIDANGIAARFFVGDAARIVRRAELQGSYLGDGEAERPSGALRVAWHRPVGQGQVHIGFQRVRARVVVEPTRLLDPYQPPSRLSSFFTAVGAAVGQALDRVGLSPVPAPRTWVMEAQTGRPLVHLVNASFDLEHPPAGTIHVVLIPPPYGRRKETPSALALTLLAGFRTAGEPLLVLRWDGRNHLGESWRDPELTAPEHAMLHYTQSQAVADLADTLTNLRQRFPTQTLRVAAITFSLAAVAVRRYLASGGEGIDLWVAPMGAADARDTIRNGNGGVDLVGEKQRGATLGVRLIQGHLVDADRHCADLIESGFADLEDARRDFALIRQPVVWLCGMHDFWVNTHRVHDVLSVPGPGDRELIEVPTGHFVRSSTEALATFRIVTERVLERLAGKRIVAKSPPPHLLLRTGQLERQRLAPVAFDGRVWWRDYLLGNRENPLGFDLIALTDEYVQLIDTQVELLDVHPGHRVADLGCGTGNVLSALVHLPPSRLEGVTIEAVDLVPEALDRAREAVRAAAKSFGFVPPPVRYQAVDLTLRDRPNLPYADGSLDRVILSLVLPYLDDPHALLEEVHRVLRPGGVLVVSTLRPDVDMSGPVARLRQKLERGGTQVVEGWTSGRLTVALRDFLNRAATLMDLEAEGRFHFHERRELDELLASHRFGDRRVVETFGVPPLALVAVGNKSAG